MEEEFAPTNPHDIRILRLLLIILLIAPILVIIGLGVSIALGNIYYF